MTRSEAEAEIKRLYRMYLGREPEASGLAYWTNLAVAGTLQMTTITQRIYDSPEAQRFRTTGAALPEQGSDDGGEDLYERLRREQQEFMENQRIESGRNEISNILRQYGLLELEQWAWNQIIAGNSAQATVNQLFDPSTEGGRVFARYFPEFQALNEARMSGAQIYVPSVQEVLELRRSYAEIMRAAGLPSGFYDQATDFVQFIVHQRSPREVAEVIQQGFQRVAQTTPEVRDAFASLYGIEGDSALAAFFLDPTAATPRLLEMARAAEAEGTAERMMGGGMGLARAERLAQLDLTRREIEAGFQQLDQIAGLFVETISETDQFRWEDEGVDAMFGLQGGAREMLDRRRRSRINVMSGGGGAIETRTGTGVGVAE